MKIPRWLAGGAKVAVTVLLLALVFRSLDVSHLAGELRSFSLASLSLLLAACWAGQLICSERWRLFAAALRMPGSYGSFVQMYFAGMIFNIGLPSLVGGDAVKAYVISRKSGRPLQVGLASVLQDRAVGLIALLAYGSAAVLISPLSWRGIPLWSVYALAWAGVAVALVLLFKGSRVWPAGLKEGERSLGRRLLGKAAAFHHALATADFRKGAALRIVFYSLIYSGLVLFVFQQVTAVAGHEVGIVPFSALFPLITIGTMLPVTLNGIGIREWLYVEALSLVGIPATEALAIALASSALLLACNLAGLAFLPALPKALRPPAIESHARPAQPAAAGHRISRRNGVT